MRRPLGEAERRDTEGRASMRDGNLAESLDVHEWAERVNRASALRWSKVAAERPNLPQPASRPGTPDGRPCPMLRRGFAAGIIEGSTVLNPNDKRLFRRYLELDRPGTGKDGGCFASVKKLSRRLGMHVDVVTRTRRRLQWFGLLVTSPEGVSPVRWFPTLPPKVTSERPEGVPKGRATDRWLELETVELDKWLRPLKEHLKAAEKRQTKSRVQDDDLSGRTDEKSGDGRTICLDRLPVFRPLRPRKAMAA
jgi:hypothetical protein